LAAKADAHHSRHERLHQRDVGEGGKCVDDAPGPEIEVPFGKSLGPVMEIISKERFRVVGERVFGHDGYCEQVG
jgi:hypothetical protein